MTTIYGIPNCDTIRRARGWLAQAGVDARFHDWRRQGVDAALLQGWVDRVGWERLLNRSGTTFRKLADAEKVGLMHGGTNARDWAIALMVAHPAAIRRPVLVHGDALEIGFDPAAYAALLEGRGMASPK